MSNVRDMIDAIASENFDGAKSALKASLAEYMAGRKFVSNKEVFGDDYSNPNEEEQEMKAELTESDEYTEVCNVCGEEVDVTVDGGETDDNGYYTCSECADKE